MDKRNSTSITIDVNENLKEQVQDLFSDLGIDINTAVNIFLRQAILHRGLPFDVRLKTSDDESIEPITVPNSYLLISTDGYSLDDYTFYDTPEQAYKAMKQAYDELDPKKYNEESYAEMSNCSESNAILYQNGENVFVWNIIKVR